MTGRIRVGISEFRVARSPAVLAAHGLGSCLGIVLYDPERQVGGLAHALLPDPRGPADDRPNRYVSTVIGLMLAQIGNDGRKVCAKLVGGANMFRPQRPGEESIGERNVRAARMVLDALGIRLAGEDVGGTQARSLEFDLQTGQVRVKFPRERDRFLLL